MSINKKKHLTVDSIKENIFDPEKELSECKKIEKTLRESEKKYRLLFNSLPYGGEVLDTDGKILLCSASTAKMLGYKESELIGRNITELLTSDSKKIFRQKFLNLLHGECEFAEIRMIRKDETELDILRSAQPILDSNDKVGTILALNVNITKRKRAEEALRKSEEKYRLISDNSYDIISFWVNNKLEYISPALERLTGYKASEVTENYSSFIHPDDVEAHIASIKYNIENKVKHAVRIERYKLTDGKYRWFENNIRNEYKSDGTTITTVVARDITDRKIAEEKLKQRENYLSALNRAKKVLLSTESKPKDVYQQVVNILGPTSNASRTYVFLNNTNEKGDLLMSQEAEYCASGIQPEITNPELQNLKYGDLFKRWHRTLLDGDLIFGRIQDFPKTEREFLARQSIKTILIIPIVTDNNFIGFIGFDNCISEKMWDNTERDFLQSAAHDLAQFIIVKREKEKQLSAHNRFVTVMDSLDAAVYVTDMQTHEILFANNRSKQIYGNDIIGKKCWQVFHDNLTAPCKECNNDKLLDKNKNPKNTYNWEFFNHHINKWLAINDRAIKWIDDRIVKLEFAVDNTDRHEATERLDKYARTQEVLLREVNHRVKNNLYAMMGMLSKEKKLYEKKNNRQQSEFIENIILRIDSLSTVHSLLSASKWQPLNLAELCRELIEHLSDSIALHKSISADIEPSEITVSSNMAHNLTLIINEITTNAIKHASPASGDLIIGVEFKTDDENILLRIKDNGPGFPQSILDGDFKNAGIGFELIFGIVKESLGGHVTIENNNGAVLNISVKKENVQL